MVKNDARSDGVKTTETAFSILERIKDSNGARISELTDDFDLAKSTIHRHLTTLRRRGYVVKEEETYHVGLRFLEFGEHARTRKEAYTIAKPVVEDLARETQERAQFLVKEHGRIVHVHRSTGERAVKTNSRIGKRQRMHATAAGKSILAHLPQEEVDQLITEQGLPKLTMNTITDPQKLYAELERVRERGYSVNKQENIEGLHAVSAPVMDTNGHVFGALSVSGPTHRMKGEWFEDELPDLLLGAANELELNITYS